MRGHNYVFKADGRIHTRYSELTLCTPNQIDRLIAIKNHELDPFESEHMRFGTDRHAMFEDEVRQTGQLPECFRELPVACNVSIDAIEKEYAVQLVRGVVVHSRPDAVSRKTKTIYDYKTVLAAPGGVEGKVNQYWSSRQGIFYALQLHYHGIEIERVAYLCELWNRDRDQILGYRQVVRQISPDDLKQVEAWAKDRIALLKSATKQYLQEIA
jgi:hypothetical protein